MAARAAVAAAPRLPNTGTGGLLESSQPASVTPWLPAAFAAIALLLGGAGTVIGLRRPR